MVRYQEVVMQYDFLEVIPMLNYYNIGMIRLTGGELLYFFHSVLKHIAWCLM